MSGRGVPLFEREFYFLRHGETDANRFRTIAGSLDVALNDTGRAQAEAAVERVRALGATHIASSHLRRARDTAATIARALALPHAVVPDLAERSWGSLEGRPQSERVHGQPPADAEAAEAFVARIRGGLAQVRAGGVPLVVAHSGTHRALCRLLGLAETVEPVGNCRPIRFTPPSAPGGVWIVDLL